MKTYLMFDMDAVLMSAAEENRGICKRTKRAPTKSQVFGMLAAALGIERKDLTSLQEIWDFCSYASATKKHASWLQDYHTSFIVRPDKTNREIETRRDELLAAKKGILSGNCLTPVEREFLNEAGFVIAIEAPLEFLEKLQEALKNPHYTLYFGRKNCVPSRPLCPRIVKALSWEEAFEKDVSPAFQHLETHTYRWEGEEERAYTYKESRKDEPLNPNMDFYAYRDEFVLEVSS